MRTPVMKRLAATLFSVAIVSAGFGCDDTHLTDRRVRERIQESRMARLKGKQDEAQALLDKAASEATASAPTRAHAKALLAHAEMDAASQLINQIETYDAQGAVAQPAGIDQRNREITRLIWEIASLGDQIRGVNTLVAVYRQFEPKEARAAAQQRIAEATGGPNQDVWVPHDKARIPTLAAVRQEIARLQSEVSQQQDQIKALQAQLAQAAQAAAQAFRNAETKTGQANLEAFKAACELRRRQAELSNQIDVAQAHLAPKVQDLATAQAREQVIVSAIDLFQKIAQQHEEGWKNIEQWIIRQQQLATAILQGVGGNEPSASRTSIAQKAGKLAKELADVQKIYDLAEQNLDKSAKHFEDAAAAAQQLSGEMKSKSSDLQRDNPMRVALETLVQVYDPSVFHLGQANATLALAGLHARRAESLAERKQLIDMLQPVLKAAGLSLPKELDDATLNDTLKSVSALADDKYTAAAELFGGVADAGGITESEKNAGRVGRIFALYGHSLLARATGDKNAADFLKQAREARDLAITDKVSIPALPAELVVVPSTQPAGAPGAAPATTPASAPAGT